MALVLADRVKETTTTTGTGAVTLAGATTGFQSFSVVGDGNTTYYCIAEQIGSGWEVGIGTYNTAGPTLARTTVLASSNGGAAVNFPAGTKEVFVTYPEDRAVFVDGTSVVIPNSAKVALAQLAASTISGVSLGNNLSNLTAGGYLTWSSGTTFNGSAASTLAVDATTGNTASKVVARDASGVVAFSSVTETVYALSGTALDASNGTVQQKTLTANTTFTDSLSSGQCIILMLVNASSYTITWPTVTWYTLAGNAAPTLSASDTIVLWKTGSTLNAAYVGKSA